MTMVCDRCGEVFLLSNDVKYMTPFDDELDQFESNSIVKCLAGDDKGIYSIRDETVVLCPSCMAKLNDWLTPDEQKPDTENKNEWNSMNVQPQCGEAVEIKFENGDLDLAYRKYADKRWFQSSGEWAASDSKIVAWRYLY